MKFIWPFVSKTIARQKVIEQRAAFYAAIFDRTDAGHAVQISKTQQQTIRYVYAVLSVLDSKASALMRFEAVILATLSVLLTKDLIVTSDPLVILIVVLTFFSIFLSLFVVSVSWEFLGIAVPREWSCSGIPTQGDIESEVKELTKALTFREGCYRWSWSLCFLSLLLLGYFVVSMP